MILLALETKTYGDEDFGVSANASSTLPVSFTASGDCIISGTTVHITSAGTCTITAHQAGNSNYNAASNVPQSFTINQKAIIVTADNKSKTYGDTITFAGTEFTTGELVSGDSVTSVILTSMGADASSPAGTYDIVPSAAEGAGLINYIITYVSATLTINKANPVITWETPADITYPTALSSTQLNATTSVKGTFVYTPSEGTILSIGNVQILSVDFTPTNTTNYNSVSASTTISVLKAISFNVTPDDLSSFNASQALIPETGNSYNSTPSLTVTGDITINVPSGSGTSRIILPSGTVISKVNGENIDGSVLTAISTPENALSGLASGAVVDGALQWGIANLGLQFDKPITLSIFVGDSFNGRTLNVVRSTSGSDGWTNDGIVPPATCVVANGLCTFNATEASYYAATHTPPPPSSSGGLISLGSYSGSPISAPIVPPQISVIPAVVSQGIGALTNFFSQTIPSSNVFSPNSAANPVATPAVTENTGNAGAAPANGQGTEQNVISNQAANAVSTAGGVPRASLSATIFNALTLGTGRNWIGISIIVILALFITYLMYFWLKKKSR